MVMKMKKKLFSAVILVTLLASVLPSLPVMAPSDPGLVGRWHFDGDVLDSSGNGNHGTVIGAPSFVPGLFGQALSFSGQDCVKVMDSSSLDITTATLEAWIKPSVSTQGAYARIIFIGRNSPNVV